MPSSRLDRNAIPPNNEGSEQTLDLRGLKCPLPVLRSCKALSALPPGATLIVLADDPLAPLDLAHLCRSEGHDGAPPDALPDGGWRFHIRKSAVPV